VAPGARLRINAIAARLGVSVSAVREASRLADEDFVVAAPQNGYSVTPISADEIKTSPKR
jgi:DNA-binding GntR family transcriptional regulator